MAEKAANPRPPKTRIASDDEPSKLCSGPCKQFLSLENPCSYHKHPGMGDGWQPMCIDCSKLLRGYNRKRQLEKDSPERIKADFIEELAATRKAKKEARALKKALAPLKKELVKGSTTLHPVDDALVLRKYWPTDPVARRRSLLKALPDAIKQCDGQEVGMAAALNIGISEIMEALEDNEELYAMWEQAQNTAISKVEAVLFKLASEGSGPDARYFLQHNRPDKYGSKTQIDIKGGFGAPNKDAAGPVSVLASIRKAASCDDE